MGLVEGTGLGWVCLDVVELGYVADSFGGKMGEMGRDC